MQLYFDVKLKWITIVLSRVQKKESAKTQIQFEKPVVVIIYILAVGTDFAVICLYTSFVCACHVMSIHKEK